MFNETNKRILFELGSVAFKEQIAPKIAAHIQRPINVRVTGKNTYLNDWLIKNLRTISSLHISLTGARSQRPGKSKRRRAKNG